jgi:peptidoglycan hydrolase-like protein with peptidoglycan-binding domain
VGDLLYDVRFIQSLDPVAALEADDPELVEAVEQAVEAFSEDLHPRADAGSSAGGQFTAGNNTAPAKVTKVTGRRPTKAAAPASTKTLGPLKTTLAYNPNTDTGPGYNSPHGDPHVHQLQQTLNRLGATDGQGRQLVDDGKLGPLTTQAVKEAQRRLGLPQDGKVTPRFLAQLQGLKALPGTPAHKPSAPHVAPKATTKPSPVPPSKPAPKRVGSGTDTARAGRAYAEAEETDVADRVSEATKQPYGDVEYADPGYQVDKQKRYPIDSEAHVRAAWSYINQSGNASPYSPEQLRAIKNKIRAAAKKYGIAIAAAEAVIDGHRTFGETEDLVRDALRARMRDMNPNTYAFVSLVDISDSQAVYTTEDADDLLQCSYSIADDDQVTLGDPVPVERTYVPVSDRNPPEDEPAGIQDTGESAAESVDRIAGRVLEAKGTDENGGRVFHMRIIKFGDSRNGRRYKEAVMREAVPLYEGAKAYDHHRTAEELRSSTLTGLVGSYRNVEARSDGLYGDLHLLPSATHAAEALDASLAAQDKGLPPLVGVSHDVLAHFQPILDGGRRLQEATQIVDVQSADVVANPSAGGVAVRAVAGGTETEEESDVPPTKADVLAALKEATGDELAEVGLARAPSKTTESTTPPTRAVESAERATEAGLFEKTSALGRLIVKDKLASAGMAAISKSFLGELPDRFTEADVDGRISTLKGALAHFERQGLAPRVTATVTKDEVDRKVESLDAMFWEYGRPRSHWSGVDATSKRPSDAPAYKSFKEAYLDFTGHQPTYLGDEDINRKILRESFGTGDYEYRGKRATESMSSSSWNLVLGDSVTRRLVAEYNEPALTDWMRVVSSMPPVNDFRTQRIERIGGYGTLSVVSQGAPYQPLTSPTNEEVTYAVAKRGGTEDVTLEMIANDDIRGIAKIPFHLALAAKRTLFDFVFEFIRPDTSVGPLGTAGNPNIYDSSALYVAGHNNTTSTALSQTALSASRAKMRKQAGYGDTANILSLIPSLLLVPPTLEEIAFQLCTSAVAIPSTPAGPSNTPNIHRGMDYIVIDYWDAQSTTGWAVVADPNLVPTVEVGFYQGQRDPQLFTQSDQTVGSMFNADKFTYKIRHIYSGAVLDFRGFQRGNS